MNNLSIAKSMMGSERVNPGQTTTAYGVATTGSVNGLVMIDMGGDTVSPDDDQSIECETTFKVFEGDEVIVSLVGADGSGKTPTVVGVVGRGDQMQSEIDNVKNYFWTNDRGAHISTIEHSIAGNNVLIDADSLDVRYGNTNDENDQILLARFGRNTAYIGGVDGMPYWTIKDLRDKETGQVTVQDYKYGDGSKVKFITDFNLISVTSVVQDGVTLEEGEDYTVDSDGSSVTFDVVPAISSEIIITYTTADGVFSYSEGIRKSGSEGPYSKTTGLLNKAIGSYSLANGYDTESNAWGSVTDGYMTVANSRLQKVFGQANVSDNSNKYIEIVGNGNTAIDATSATITTDGETSQFTLPTTPYSILSASASCNDSNYFNYTPSVTRLSDSRTAMRLEVRFTWDNEIPVHFGVEGYYVLSYGIGKESDGPGGTITRKTKTVRWTSGDIYPRSYCDWNIAVLEDPEVYYLSDYSLVEYSLTLKNLYNFSNYITRNGYNITLPEFVYSSNGSVCTISYNHGSLVRGNAYNLDWYGNAEYKGEVYLGGCTPNGETPYPAIRFNTYFNPRYNTGDFHEEYYDGSTWKALAHYYRPGTFDYYGWDPDNGIERPLIGNGFITGSGKVIRLQFIMPKDLSLISNITLGDLEGGMRGIKGYINSSSYNTDWLSLISGSGYSYEIVFEGTTMNLLINKSSTFGNYTNNTPVTFESTFIQLGFDYTFGE